MIHSIRWNKAFSVGVPELDDDHRESIRLINQFIDGVNTQKSRDDLSPILVDLVKLTREHFDRENRIIDEYDVDNKVHVREHDELMSKLKTITGDFHKGADAAPLPQEAERLKAWFIDHVVALDSRIKGFIG